MPGAGEGRLLIGPGAFFVARNRVSVASCAVVTPRRSADSVSSTDPAGLNAVVAAAGFQVATRRKSVYAPAAILEYE